MPKPYSRFAYAGSFSRVARAAGADPETCGISVYGVNDADGKLELVQQLPAENPFFVAFHPSGSHLYVVNLIGDFEGTSGSIESYSVNQESGELSFVNRTSTIDTSPCHLAVDPSGRFLTVANYGGGSWVVVPIGADGSVGPAVHREARTGSGPNPARQDASYPHAITASPNGRFLIGADLGTDRVIVFALDTETGRLDTVMEASVAPGSGPRHVAFNAAGDRLYVINELSATITLFPFHPETGTIGVEVQTILTVQPEAVGPMTTSEIFLHPSGRFLYGSNRGQIKSVTPESDAIVAFAVNQSDGSLSLIGHMTEEIGVPWNFAIAPDGAKLYVPNFDLDSISVYDIDQQTGALTWSGLKYDTPKPVCFILQP